jgi:hydroxymethylpyrimidine/phosphomethylpyrimidine kinase
VVDPVMVATSGDLLLELDAIAAFKSDLFPLAQLITPNLPEAARLLDAREAVTEVEAVAQAKALLALGCGAVLLKGGHGEGADAVDILCDASGVERLARPRVDTRNTHGTGCTLSAAIAALLAQGVALREAVGRAKTYVWQALQAGRDLGVGHGNGPVDHLYAIRRSPPPA